MKIAHLILFLLVVVTNAYSNSQDTYRDSTKEHLYEEFDYFPNTDTMDCDNATECRFNTKYDAHFGATITILLIAFFLIFGLIGFNPDYVDYSSSVMPLSKKRKNEINAQPIYFGGAIIVFVVALYLIKYIRHEDTNKILNFAKQTLTLEDRDGNKIKSYNLHDLKSIELLHYDKGDYQHYELNLEFENKRINLYAGRDSLLCTSQARELSTRLHKPIEKIKTEF
jgi:hypothetical protein